MTRRRNAWAVQVFAQDTLEEQKCKRIYNANMFGVFRDNYNKFRNYAILIGA